MSDRIDLQEFVGGFVTEADELTAAASASLLEIEGANTEGAVRPRAVRDLFRALHTIKGLAGMVGVEPIADIAHALETLIRDADRAGGQLSRTAVEVSLVGVAAIRERVRAVADGRVPAPVPAGLLERIAAVDASSGAAPPPPIATEWDGRLSVGERNQLTQGLHAGTPAWTIVFEPSADNAARGITIASVRAAVSGLGEIVKVVPRAVDPAGGRAAVTFEILVLSAAGAEALATAAATSIDRVVAIASLAAPSPDLAPAPLLAPAPVAPDVDDTPGPLARAVVRVELSRLDDLQEQLSLLIVSRFRIEREIANHAALGHDVRRLREVAELQARQLRDLRRAILRARMVRAAEVLEPLGLLVRSVARSSRKEVRLEVDAGVAELDKAVADQLLPALVHLVRNAIDHGLEAPDDRVAAGKPRAGTVLVTCREIAGSQIEVVVRDDGRGIARDAVATSSGRRVDDDDALLEVLTTPGFSTRAVADQTSGRGLGMDIVRKIAVSQLGGELAVETGPGAGTAFTLRVPVTIAVIDVFSFVCGPQSFVVPVSAVEEIFEVAPELVVTPPSAVGAAAFALLERRGRAIPLVSLGAALAIDGGAAARKALVIRRNGEPLAFTVDRMLGRQEVVVRPVDDPLVSMPGIAGATDLGDGRPTLVLDLLELGELVRDRMAS